LPEQLGDEAERPLLDRLMTPSSVAVVGATDRPGSYGAQTLRNLADWSQARVIGINPHRDRVLGVSCVPSLRDLDGPVDAVVVATPAATVVGQVSAAATTGCGGVIVYADRMTPVQTAELAVVAAEHRLAVLGPNTNGVVDVGSRTALWGDPLRMPPQGGQVAVVTQSGNIGVGALAHRRGAGLHSVIALGNAVALDAADVLAHLAGQSARGPGPRAVALYLEDDGDGARLAESLAACAEQDVRLAVLKAGRSAAGRAAAAAHNEALLGSHRVFTALVREAGGVVVDDVHDLLETARALTGRRRSRGIAVVTCSGGDAAIAADLADSVGMPLPPFGEATRTRLGRLLPGVAPANPLDHTNRVWADRTALADLVETVALDPAVDAVVYVQDEPADLLPDAAAEWETTRAGAADGAARADVSLLLVATLPGQEPGGPSAPGVVSGLRPAVAGLAALRRGVPDRHRLRAVAAAARRSLPAGVEDAPSRPEHEAKALLAQHGIATPAGMVATTVTGAVDAARRVGLPCAVKVSARGLLHKSAVAAVETGVGDLDEVRRTAARLLGVAGELGGGVLLVERMVPAGVEILVAARADGVVPVLVLGMGGRWAEVLDDVVVVPLPADQRRVHQALMGLRGVALLRAGTPDAVDHTVALAARLGTLLLERRWRMVELNPVVVTSTEAVAVDAVLVPGTLDDPPHRVLS
jgi:acetyl-CoA synthetase